MRTPLVWHNLTDSPRRLLLAATGIAFAAVLMFMQTGFRDAMLGGQVALIEALDADLVLAHRLQQTISANQPFPRRRLSQAQACPGVQSARALYVRDQALRWKDTSGRATRPVRVVAFDPRWPTLTDPAVAVHAAALSEPDVVLFDGAARPSFGPTAAGTAAELAGRRVRVVGGFHLGPDFSNDGTVLMSDRSLADYLADERPPAETLSRVQLGLVGLAPGASAEAVRDHLRQALPADVAVYTKVEFVAKERRYWATRTPIGLVFGLGTLVGFVVGVVIAYQIMYASVTSNFAQYATLKAIGYGDGFLLGVVVREGLLLSAFGFVPGALLSAGLYRLMAEYGHLPMRMSVGGAALIFALTTALCALSAAVAARKVLSSDPAEVF